MIGSRISAYQVLSRLGAGGMGPVFLAEVVKPVAGLAMGIIVDDTVHFLVKYNDARRRGAGAREAVLHAFEAVGSALLATSLIVSAGFAVLALSSFRVTAYMGTLTALTVVAALLTDFLLLPALLLWLDRDRAAAPQQRALLSQQARKDLIDLLSR